MTQSVPSYYTPEHRAELEELLRSPDWQQIIASGLIDEVKANRLEPGTAKNFIATVVEQLLRFNRERVERLISDGRADPEKLLSELSQWPENLGGQDPVVSFLGLNVTAKCDFDPRCVYCNQPWIESSVGLDGWKRVVEEVTAGTDGGGCYIYITGGEPLTLGEDLWGDNGLIRFATERGARVNVNTNAATLTPEIALRFINAGLARLHVSLDSAEPGIHNHLAGGDRFQQVLTGIYNVQIARDLVGVAYPLIHTNCVLTNHNYDGVPALLAFILAKHKQTSDRNDPFYQDLFPHLSPVGGGDNASLRPSEEDFRSFYVEIWPQVCEVWDRYQENLGVPKDERTSLFGPFSNPFLRVEHQGGLDAYVETAARGLYGRLALSGRCYVAPTQAAFAPDGFQYRCGSHAIRRILATGNVNESGVFDNIRAGASALDDLPHEEHCYGCALATLYINQAVESKLNEELDSMLAQQSQVLC